MKSAVCLLLPLSDSHVLAISRRNDTTRWGLPGGKVDPGESNIRAMTRETFEEVGLSLDPAQLEPLYSAACMGKGPEDSYWVTTYLWTGPVSLLMDLTAEEGMTVNWKTPAELCNPDVSPFAAYNVGAFAAYRAYQAGGGN